MEEMQEIKKRGRKSTALRLNVALKKVSPSAIAVMLHSYL